MISGIDPHPNLKLGTTSGGRSNDFIEQEVCMIMWLALLICTVLILYSGSKLSKYGDVIAEKTGLGRTWIGMILI